MQSKALTVAEYLATLPADRRSAIQQVRAVIRKHLPQGYAEQMQYGMISYVVPLALYPAGYLDKRDVPLPFISLASQKQYMAIYLMNVSGDPELEAWFKAAWQKSQKKLDMGKACLRFNSVEDLALDVLGEAVTRSPLPDYISRYELAHPPRPTASPRAKKPPAPSPGAKEPPTASPQSKKRPAASPRSKTKKRPAASPRSKTKKSPTASPRAKKS
jgi:uncharacterized protein DUF1801